MGVFPHFSTKQNPDRSVGGQSRSIWCFSCSATEHGVMQCTGKSVLFAQSHSTGTKGRLMWTSVQAHFFCTSLLRCWFSEMFLTTERKFPCNLAACLRCQSYVSRLTSWTLRLLWGDLQAHKWLKQMTSLAPLPAELPGRLTRSSFIRGTRLIGEYPATPDAPKPCAAWG